MTTIAACPSTCAGTWEHEVEAVDGKIVITRKDGSQAVLTYSEATSPADVRVAVPSAMALFSWQACPIRAPSGVLPLGLRNAAEGHSFAWNKSSRGSRDVPPTAPANCVRYLSLATGGLGLAGGGCRVRVLRQVPDPRQAAALLRQGGSSMLGKCTLAIQPLVAAAVGMPPTLR